MSEAGGQGIDAKVAPFLQPGWWNGRMESSSLGKLSGCVSWGMWALFFANDNGEFMNKCMNLVGGMVAVYDEPPSA